MTSARLPTQADRFLGCFLGQAIGDAVGSPVEGMSAEMIYHFFGDSEALMTLPGDRQLHYTDDTEMLIGVAQTLLEHGTIVEETLVARFVANLSPARGYGSGAIRILQAMSEGRDWRHLTATIFPGGSYGNGAAMRVAPVGLVFSCDLDRVWEEARLSSLCTHIHPLGIEGAQLLAIAIAWQLQHPVFDSAAMYTELIRRATTDEFLWLLSTSASLSIDDSVSILGNGIEAQRSVVTSIACFALSPDSYVDSVGRAIGLGGDTDTLAAMTGALSGTHLGVSELPAQLVHQLENGKNGRDVIAMLAQRLHDRTNSVVESN
jgi:poly(ADP-ribose) glycohydrolase ARH3